MSYLFAAYLWKKQEYAPLTLGSVWSGAEPRFAGEQLVYVTVTPKVMAAFYFSGSFSTKSEAFAYACETLLSDGWGEAPAEERRKAGDYEFRYFVWLSSDMFEYDVAVCYEGTGFQGRAMIDGQGERVVVEDDVVKDYELTDTGVDPEEFGVVDEDDENFDEREYEKARIEREKPFSPGEWIHDVLGVTRQQVILALHKAWDKKGKTLWPEGGAKDTPELRKELEAGDSCAPDLPMWSEWGDGFVPKEKPAPTPIPAKKTSSEKKAARGEEVKPATKAAATSKKKGRTKA